MPFRWKNAGTEYGDAMKITSEVLIGKSVFVYVDDIVIYAKTLEEQNRLFDEVSIAGTLLREFHVVEILVPIKWSETKNS